MSQQGPRPGPHYEMPLPSKEEQMARMRHLVVAGGVAVDMPGAVIELLYAFGTAYLGETSPRDGLDVERRVRTLAARTFEDFRRETANAACSLRMVETLAMALDVDREKVGY